MSVLVPTQRQCPGGCGVSLTGTGWVESSASDVSATIGSENVTLKFGTNSTAPSGRNRSILNGNSDPDAVDFGETGKAGFAELDG